jgi:hypothetical protein
LLLTITTTHRPATDLGCLLHKNPARTQTFDLDVGRAHVFYPQASVDACTVALLLDIDPISLVRTARRASLRQYVNDRPYVASSFMSSAILKVFGSAMSGASQRPAGAGGDRDPTGGRCGVFQSPSTASRSIPSWRG